MNSNETYEIDKCGGLTLIIGGAYQGKLTYAVQRLGFNAAAVLDLAATQCPEANVFDSVIGGNSNVYIHFEALTQKIAAEYADLEVAVKRLDDDFLAPLFTLSEKKRTALIAREIGCGVVPLSEKDRLWRGAARRRPCKGCGKSRQRDTAFLRTSRKVKIAKGVFQQ